MKVFTPYATKFWPLLSCMFIIAGCDKSDVPAPIEVHAPRKRLLPTSKPLSTVDSRIYQPHTDRAITPNSPQAWGPSSQDSSQKRAVTVQALSPLTAEFSSHSSEPHANKVEPTAPVAPMDGPNVSFQNSDPIPLPALPTISEPPTEPLNHTPTAPEEKKEKSVSLLSNPRAFLAQELSSPPAHISPSEQQPSEALGTQNEDKIPTKTEPKGNLDSKTEKAPAHAPTFSWPVVGKILSRFGRKDAQHFNDGINIAARLGMPIRAAADGAISYTGDKIAAFGQMLVIKHQHGWSSTYAHVSKLLVKTGQSVRRGQIIAHAGATGQVTEPQLHFEIRFHGEPVPPFDYLGP